MRTPSGGPGGVSGWFILIAGLGLAIRLALAVSSDPVMSSDALEYHQYAESLVKDHRYQIVYSSRQPALRGMVLSSFRPPGYPFFIALIYSVFGIKILPGLVIQGVLDFFSGIFLYLLAACPVARVALQQSPILQAGKKSLAQVQ